MPKYIDADSFRLELNNGIDTDTLCCQEDIDRFLYHFPAADVEPVRHGRWVHTDLAAHWRGKDECNQCGYHEKDRRDMSRYRYCPNCGAKMDLKVKSQATK